MIREATHDDLSRLVELGAVAHNESPHYGRYPYNGVKVYATLAAALENSNATILVAENDAGEVVGVLFGVVGTQLFSSAKYATDVVFFVDALHRGGHHARNLLRRFEEWAAERGAHELTPGISSGVAPGRTRDFYAALGYEELGYIMVRYI